MSANGGRMDVRQLLAHGGDASSLSEVELGRLQKQYEKLRREWARKRRKLEKLDRAAKAKQHVRQRLQDQSSETGGAADTASPIQQPYSSGDVDQEKLSVCEDKSDHLCREDLTGADSQSRKSVSFSLDVLSSSENIQQESLSTVLTTEESTVESTLSVPSKTDSPRVFSHPKGEDMSTNVLQQGLRTSYNLDGLHGSENNNILRSEDTVNKADGNDSSTHHQDISAPQESPKTPSMGKTSACSRENSSENKHVENLNEQGELNCVLHCDNVKQKISPDNKHKRPLFKGLSKQAVLEEKLEQISGPVATKRKVSDQNEHESHPITTDNKSARNISASTCVPNSSLELVEEVSLHEVIEKKGCEKKIPDQEIHGALGDTIIVLDSQESQTECSDNFCLSSNVLSKSKAKEEKNMCMNSSKDNRACMQSMFGGSPNMPPSTTGSVSAHKSLAQGNSCRNDSIIVLDSQETETECSAISNLPSDFLSESERSANEEKDICVDMGTPHTSETMLAGSPNVHVPASITGPVHVSSRKSLAQENKICNNDVSQTTAQFCTSQEKLHTEEDSQVVAPTQRSFQENTWVDGLMFPAEYYVRTTRGMQRQGRTPEGVARQVRARKPRRQKRKLGADSQDASEGACGSKQARLKEVRSDGITLGEEKLSSDPANLEVAKDCAVSLKVLEEVKTLTKESFNALSPGLLSTSLSENDLRSDKEAPEKLQFSTEVAKDMGGRGGVSSPAGQGSGATGVHGSTSTGEQVCSTSGEGHLSTGEQVCSTPGEGHLSTGGQACSTGGQVCSTPGEGHLSTDGQACSTGGQVCSTPASPGEDHLSADVSSQDSVIPDTQYSPANSAFPLRDPQKCLQANLPKDLFSEDAVQDNLHVLRKGREAASSHNTPVHSSGLRRLVRGRKMTRSCQNSPAGFSSVPGEGNLSHQDQCQVVSSVEKGRKMTRSCQNSPVPTAGLLSVPGENLTLQDQSQVVSSVQRRRKMTKSCQDSPIQSIGFSSVPGEGNLSPKDWSQDSSQRSEEGLYRRSRRLAVRCSQEPQTNASQSTPKLTQKDLKEVQIVKVPGQSETIPRVVQDSKKDITKTRKIFPIPSDRLKEKLENSEASEFHLPYSDYGTLKVAKAREAPPTDFSRNCRSSATDPKDIPVASEESSVNLNEDETLSSTPRLTETSRKKQRLVPSPYIRNTPSPINISKTELGQEKKQSVFPCLSPLLHKKCTEEVLDFSLVGQEFVKLKLSKVKSSPRPAAATSSSGHGKHRQQYCTAKVHLPTSGTRSENYLNEKGHECADVENDKQKMGKIAEADFMAKSFLHKDNKEVVDSEKLPGHVDTHAQHLLVDTSLAVSGVDTESEVTPSPDPGSEREVKVMCEVKTSSAFTHTSQVKCHQSVDVLNSKSSSHKEDVTTSEKSNVCNSEPQESPSPADDKGEERGTEVNVPSAHSKESVSSLRTQEIKGLGVEVTCVGVESVSLTPAQDHRKKSSQGTGVEVTRVGACGEGLGRREVVETETDPASVTPAQDSHEMTLQETGVEETGEDVATSLPEFSACLQLRAETVVAMVMGEAIIQGETAPVLAVCQRTQLVVWVQRGQGWIHTAAWDILKEEEVCDICLLPREVGVQLVVGGNFPSGHLRLFYTDGVSSRLDHSWADAEDGGSCHGDRKLSYHAMTVLPGSVAIATGPYDRGSSVCKVAFSSRNGHVHQHTRLAMPAVQRVGSLQPVRGCEGCLLGTSRNQVLLWNHITGVLLRCVDLPGVSPQLTCLYAAADQGLIFALVSNHGKEQQEAGCSLLSINPATACTLTLQKYQLPQGRGLGRCVQEYLCGSRLFAALDSGEVCMWDVLTAQMGAVLQGDTRGSTCLTVDRNLLCLGTSQGCVHLYNL